MNLEENFERDMDEINNRESTDESNSDSSNEDNFKEAFALKGKSGTHTL